MPQAGFTVVELLVAFSVSSMVVATAFGAVERFLPRWRVRLAAQDVASAIRATRAQAIQARQTERMPFDVRGRRFSVVGRSSPGPARFETSGGVTRKVVKLPPGVDFKRPDQTGEAVTLREPMTWSEAAVFNSRGRLESSAAPGYVYLSNPRKSIYARVVVDLTGNVRVETRHGNVWR